MDYPGHSGQMLQPTHIRPPELHSILAYYFRYQRRGTKLSHLSHCLPIRWGRKSATRTEQRDTYGRRTTLSWPAWTMPLPQEQRYRVAQAICHRSQISMYLHPRQVRPCVPPLRPTTQTKSPKSTIMLSPLPSSRNFPIYTTLLSASTTSAIDNLPHTTHMLLGLLPLLSIAASAPAAAAQAKTVQCLSHEVVIHSIFTLFDDPELCSSM